MQSVNLFLTVMELARRVLHAIFRLYDRCNDHPLPRLYMYSFENVILPLSIVEACNRSNNWLICCVLNTRQKAPKKKNK